MSNKEYAAQMQQLADTVVLNPDLGLFELPGILQFGNPDYFVPDQTLQKFDQMLADLGTIMKMSVKAFRAEAISSIVANQVAGNKWNEQVWSSWLKGLKAKPITLSTTYVSLSGIELKAGKPLTLGPYSVYRLPTHRKALFDKYPKLQGQQLTNFMDLIDGSEYLLAFSAEARDTEFSEELALSSLDDFSSIIHFMVGISRSIKDIELFEIDKRSQKRLTLSQNQGKFGVKWPDIERPNISIDKYFLSKKIGNDKLWRLIAATNRNELEEAVVLAVKWIGKAAADRDISRAFVQCMFAIEALLVVEPGFVTPSIGQQVREGCAFLLNRDPKKRLDIDSDIPKLYKIRSQIVHAHSSSATTKDLSKIFQIAQALVYQIINAPEFAQWTSPIILAGWIKRYKYNASKKPRN